MPRALVINGPNLNRLGQRQPEIYGTDSLADIEVLLGRVAASVRWEIATFQSNHEGAIIDRLQEADFDGLIINPGALSHYSHAIADALRGLDVPAIEVHVSNIHARESFRHRSVTAGACLGVIAGLGPGGYIAALHHLAARASGAYDKK